MPPLARGEVLLRPPAGLDGPQEMLRLPPATAIPGEAGSFPNSPLETVYPDAEYYEFMPGDNMSAPQKLTSHKNGFFQKLCLSGAWIGTGGEDNLGITEIETALTVALPLPIREWPLLITPSYNVRFLDGPTGPTGSDLPPQLHDVYVDFMWLPTFVNRYTLMLAVAPSYFSDFEQSHDKAFRLTGKALVIYDWSPERLQLVAGVLYLNRDNIRLLPAGGAIWNPTDWARFELLFPKPKLALRLNVGDGYEDWVYTTAEFGGNTWAIERSSGASDNVTLADYRLLMGVERKLNGGAGYRLEGGYVFGRSVEFSSGIGDFDPQNTFILRGGLVF